MPTNNCVEYTVIVNKCYVVVWCVLDSQAHAATLSNDAVHQWRNPTPVRSAISHPDKINLSSRAAVFSATRASGPAGGGSRTLLIQCNIIIAFASVGKGAKQRQIKIARGHSVIFPSPLTGGGARRGGAGRGGAGPGGAQGGIGHISWGSCEHHFGFFTPIS